VARSSLSQFLAAAIAPERADSLYVVPARATDVVSAIADHERIVGLYSFRSKDVGNEVCLVRALARQLRTVDPGKETRQVKMLQDWPRKIGGFRGYDKQAFPGLSQGVKSFENAGIECAFIHSDAAESLAVQRESSRDQVATVWAKQIAKQIVQWRADPPSELTIGRRRNLKAIKSVPNAAGNSVSRIRQGAIKVEKERAGHARVRQFCHQVTSRDKSRLVTRLGPSRKGRSDRGGRRNDPARARTAHSPG
jgi:hypothetical protein